MGLFVSGLGDKTKFRKLQIKTPAVKLKRWRSERTNEKLLFELHR